MLSVDSASLVKYNANVRGKDVGDCVCRSISLAFDLSYSETSKLLNEQMRASCKMQWNITSVFRPVINQLGGVGPTPVNDTADNYPTVNEFADENSVGCFLVMCGKTNKGTSTNHIVCIIDGKIYDSWDCRNYYAKQYYTCSNDRHIQDTDLDNQLENLALSASDLAEKEITRFADRNFPKIQRPENIDFSWYLNIFDCQIEGYTIKLGCRFEYTIYNKTTEDKKVLRFKIACVLKPGMSVEDAKELIVKTIKQRAYDRMYTVRDSIKNDLEEFEFSHLNGEDSAEQNRLFLTSQEERFYRKLPGKIKPFIRDVDIRDPNQYHDSYTIRIRRMPNDPNTEKEFVIEAYEASSAKDMIDRYITNFERPYDDYDPIEEY